MSIEFEQADNLPNREHRILLRLFIDQTTSKFKPVSEKKY